MNWFVAEDQIEGVARKGWFLYRSWDGGGGGGGIINIHVGGSIESLPFTAAFHCCVMSDCSLFIVWRKVSSLTTYLKKCGLYCL